MTRPRGQIELARAGALGAGGETRRWVLLALAVWLALVAVIVAGFALLEPWVLLAALPLLLLSRWVDGRWSEIDAVRCDAEPSDEYDSPAQEELAHELADRGDRAQTLLLLRRLFTEDEAVMEMLYPTREALVVRSVQEGVQTFGIALVIVAWPVRPLIALGGALWFGFGRSSRRLIAGVLPERWFRTPISTEERQRWLERERWAIVAAVVPVIVYGLFKFWL
jgi:hypothetical protein